VEALIGRFLVLLMAAVVVERLVEFLFARIVNMVVARFSLSEDAKATIMQWLSACVGVGVTYMFGLGFFSLAFDIVPRWAQFDVVVTGVLIAGGSNYMHTLVKRLELSNWLDKATSQALQE
jgi:hypothetical protein